MMSRSRHIGTSVLITLVALFLLAMPRFASTASWEQVNPEQVEAFEKGDLEEVKRIVATDKEFNNRYQVRQALLYAIDSGNLELFKYLKSLGWLEECRKADQMPHCYPLHMLAAKPAGPGMEMLSFFIANGFDVNAFNHTQEIPLQAAARKGQFEIIKFLCEHGANPDLTYHYSTPTPGASPTAFEIVKGNLDAAKQYNTPEVIRYRTKLAKIVDYLESGQCQKK